MSRIKTLNVNATWVWLILLATVVALLGGSSRPDAVQIAVLRPLVALILIPALYYLSLRQLREAKSLVWLLGLLAAWMTLQIVPLPPSVWQTLPGRDLVTNLDASNFSELSSALHVFGLCIEAGLDCRFIVTSRLQNVFNVFKAHDTFPPQPSFLVALSVLRH